MSETEVNIPLLRKAVEWAESEAAKPAPLREWEQSTWVITPQDRARWVPDEWSDETERALYEKAPECGTCYCVAGYVASTTVEEFAGYEAEYVAAKALGIGIRDANDLFSSTNRIEDVRRIAEEIAGERL